jgi:RNA polymerase sigma-70 factor (ECF subfamily)
MPPRDLSPPGLDYGTEEVMADRRSDGELVAAAVTGSQEAFDELMARHRDSVFGVALHRLEHLEEAQDAAQDAFVKAYLNLTSLREPAAFGAWLRRIADGTALDIARRPKREVRLDSADSSPARPPDETSARAEAVRQVLTKLPDSYRRVITLHYQHGYSLAEIARALRTSVSAVKTRLDRARGRLLGEMVTMAQDTLKDTTLVYVCAFRLPGTGFAQAIGASGDASPLRRLRLAQFAFDVGSVWPAVARKLRSKEDETAALGNTAAIIIEDGIACGAQRLRMEVSKEGGRRGRASMVVHYTVRGKEQEGWGLGGHCTYPLLRGYLASLVGLLPASDQARGTGPFLFRAGEGTYQCEASLIDHAVEVAIGRPVRRVSPALPPLEWRDATPRITHIILDQSFRRQASAARITLGRGGSEIDVSLQKDGEWSRLMHFSAQLKLRSKPPEQHGAPVEQPIWSLLREHLAGLAGVSLDGSARRQTGRIRFRSGNKEREMRAVFSARRVWLSFRAS